MIRSKHRFIHEWNTAGWSKFIFVSGILWKESGVVAQAETMWYLPTRYKWLTCSCFFEEISSTCHFHLEDFSKSVWNQQWDSKYVDYTDDSLLAGWLIASCPKQPKVVRLFLQLVKRLSDLLGPQTSSWNTLVCLKMTFCVFLLKYGLCNHYSLLLQKGDVLCGKCHQD